MTLCRVSNSPTSRHAVSSETSARVLCAPTHETEGQMLRQGVVVDAPLIEEPAVAEGHVILWLHSQALRHSIDPIGGAFKLREVPDRCFIDNAMAFSVTPLRAPLLITEGFYQAE